MSDLFELELLHTKESEAEAEDFIYSLGTINRKQRPNLPCEPFHLNQRERNQWK